MPTAPAPHHAKVQAKHWPTPEPATGDEDAGCRSIAGLREAGRRAAAAARCGATRRRPCSAKGPTTRRSCSSASSPATRRILPASLSSGRRARCSMRSSTKPAIDRAEDLRHQCGEALQVRAARQAPHPLKAERRRGPGLPLVAGPGTGADQAGAGRGAGRDGGAVAARQGGADHQDARPGDRARGWAAGVPDDPPVLHPAHPGAG